MAISFVSGTMQRFSIGNRVGIMVNVQLDSSYPSGGYLLDKALLGLITIEKVIFCDDNGGYNPEFDYTNSKLFMRNSTGGTFVGDPMTAHNHDLLMVIDESLAVAADTATMANNPAVVQNVYADAAGVVGAKQIVPAGVAPATGQVALDNLTGVLTFNNGDAVTNCLVTSIPQSGGAGVASASAGTPAGTISGSASGQVANGTNLSSVVLKLLILGQ